MSRHAAPRNPAKALLRAGLTVSAAGLALGAAGGAAHAAEGAAAPAEGQAAASAADAAQTPSGPTSVVLGALNSALTPAGDLQLNPLANTSVDPLANALGTQVADFKPISTEILTGPLARGASLSDLLPG
ncbi:hypothetical protein [Streptomyces sp. NPDC060194]|uniref:hypothetical protein n=1 Tax=Streptomyces sp. NPDC060194 TaxID=3347069 RepID=UPI00365678EE